MPQGPGRKIPQKLLARAPLGSRAGGPQSSPRLFFHCPLFLLRARAPPHGLFQSGRSSRPLGCAGVGSALFSGPPAAAAVCPPFRGAAAPGRKRDGPHRKNQGLTSSLPFFAIAERRARAAHVYSPPPLPLERRRATSAFPLRPRAASLSIVRGEGTRHPRAGANTFASGPRQRENPQLALRVFFKGCVLV